MLFFLLGACQTKKVDEGAVDSSTPKSALKVTQEQEKTGGIQTGTLSEKPFSTTFQVKGKVDIPPQNRVSISPPMGGYLYSTPLLPGMRVKKGQSLAVLQDKTYIDLMESYLTAKSKLTWLDVEYQRQRELAASKAVSDKIVQEAQYQVTQQNILVKSMAEKLKLVGIDPRNNLSISRFLTLRSPLTGVISEVRGNIGQYIQPTEVLFEILNLSDVHLSLQLFEQDIERVSVGQKFKAFTNSQPKRPFTGTVLTVSPVYSENKTVNVQCHFDQDVSDIALGTYMNVTLVQPTKTHWSLPKEAVVQRGAQNWVYEGIGPQTYRRVLVQVGEEKEGWLPIIFPTGLVVKDTRWAISGAYALYMVEENTD